MKKLFKLSVLLLALTFTFFSCKNASITKRHYNKGYYVSHSTKHGKTKATKQTAESAEKLDALTAKTQLGTTNTEDRGLMASALNAKSELADASVKAGEVNKPVTAKKVENNALPFSEKMTSLKNKVQIKPIPANLLESARDRDGLSLIWLLIVILAILYLLGILFNGFGMGGLIHILGVVIVVLLILWLLRLI